MLFRFFSFRGRATRQEFWFIGVITSVLLTALVFVSVSMLAGSIDTGSVDRNNIDKKALLEAMYGPGLFFLGGVVLLVGLPGYAVSARRLHDRNKSGLWLLIFPASFLLTVINIASGGELISHSTLFVFDLLVGLASMWFTFELGFLKGTDGSNRFDGDPLAGRKIADDFAGSWADRPIEDIVRSSSLSPATPVRVVSRTPQPRQVRATAPQGFGRRGLGT